MQIQYADSDGVAIAYVADGSGELPLIYVPGLFSNLALEGSMPALARFHERLARFTRFARWDRRGTGLSDQSADPLSLAEQGRDLEAVRRALGFERFALVGFSHGALVAARYAAENPERVSQLVLIGALVCGARDPADPDSAPLYPWDRVEKSLGDFSRYAEGLIRMAAPSVAPEARVPGVTLLQASVNPKGMRQLVAQVRDADLRPLIPGIRVPTLVVHARDDRIAPVAHGRYLAERIPEARYVEIESDFHVFFLDPTSGAVVLTAIEEFLTGAVVHSADRVMTTVLFTDVVDSAAAQQRLGDEAWRTLRKALEASSRRIAEQFGGRVVEATGDGVMAAFPAASQALRAARALAADARGLGVAVRAGAHAGEAYTVDEHLFGTCVTVAARVVAQAGADEILTTETVQDLVAGSGFAFRDAGRFELKGIGERRLLAVEAGSAARPG